MQRQMPGSTLASIRTYRGRSVAFPGPIVKIRQPVRRRRSLGPDATRRWSATLGDVGPITLGSSSSPARLPAARDRDSRASAGLGDSHRMPEWRNGRRGGLKIPCLHGRVGSTPTSGTKPSERCGRPTKVITVIAVRDHGVRPPSVMTVGDDSPDLCAARTSRPFVPGRLFPVEALASPGLSPRGRRDRRRRTSRRRSLPAAVRSRGSRR